MPDRSDRPGAPRLWLNPARTAATALAAMLALSGCAGLDLGMNPGPDVRKERGPLVVPPPGVMAGTAQ